MKIFWWNNKISNFLYIQKRQKICLTRVLLSWKCSLRIL